MESILFASTVCGFCFRNLHSKADMETTFLPNFGVFLPDDGRFYIAPSPQVLDQLASRWWSLILGKHGSDNLQRECMRASRLASCFAANFEIQAWRSGRRKKNISKACFFRRVALELVPNTNSEALAGLKAKYAATLLVKRSHSPDASLGATLIQTIREITSLYPKRPVTKFVVVSMLLWLIYDYSSTDIRPSDLQTAVTFFEQATADAPQDFEGKCSVCGCSQRYPLDSCVGLEDSTTHEVDRTPLECEDRTRPCVSFCLLVPLNRARMEERIQRLKSFKPVEHGKPEESRDRVRACEDFISSQQAFKMNLEFHIPLFSFVFKEAVEVTITADLWSAETVQHNQPPRPYVLRAINYLQCARKNRSRTELEQAACYIQTLTAHVGLDPDNSLPHLHYVLAGEQFAMGLSRKDPELLYLGCKNMAAMDDPISDTPDLPMEAKLPTIVRMMRWSHEVTAGEGYMLRKTTFIAARLAAHISPHIIGNPCHINGYEILCEIGQISAAMITGRIPQSLLLDPVLYWNRCWQDPGGSLAVGIKAMHLTARFLSSCDEISLAYRYASVAVELTQFACPSHLDREERERLVPLLNGISVDACALGLRLGLTQDAIELLEQGRHISNDDLVIYTDALNSLQEEHPDLSEEFYRLRQTLLESFKPCNPDVSDLCLESGYGDPEELFPHNLEQLPILLKQIRRLPKYRSFLRPVSLPEMYTISAAMPVVVLVGGYMSTYALVIKTRGTLVVVDLNEGPDRRAGFHDLSFFDKLSKAPSIRRTFRMHVNLSATGQSEVTFEIPEHDNLEPTEELIKLSRTLWHNAVEPINKILGYERPPKNATQMDVFTRTLNNTVTWIRTGTFSHMPIHLARDGDGIPFIFRAVSSYSASFQALSTSASRTRKGTGTTSLDHGIMLTMPSRPPIDGRLRNTASNSTWLRADIVELEVSGIKSVSRNIDWSLIERPNVELAKQRIAAAKCVHFICHGIDDPEDPRQNHLKLWKAPRETDLGSVDPLYASEIRTWRLEKTAVIFLSACWTAASSNRHYSDANSTILDAFVDAGVPDVVGSMWSVSSTTALMIAAGFWSCLSHSVDQNVSVAQMLHYAMLICAFARHEDLINWGGFIHTGGFNSVSLDDIRAYTKEHINSWKSNAICDGCGKVRLQLKI